MKAAKIDLNQLEIVTALRKAGISVQSTSGIGKGFPDLVCALGENVWLMEVKGPKGKLTPDQVEFISAWKGVVHIVRTPEEALMVVGHE